MTLTEPAPAAAPPALPAAPPAPQWVPPAEVAPVTARDVRTVAVAVSRALGMRPAGWAMLAAGAVLLVSGWLLGWMELRVAGLAAVMLLVVAALLTIGRSRLQVGLEVPDRHVTVGERATGRIQVANAGTRRTLPGRLELPLGDRVASLALPSLGAGQERTEEYVIPTTRRAVVTVGPAASVHGDPFGLMGRDKVWAEAIEVYVHPRTVDLPGRQTGFVHDLEGHPTQKLSSSDMSFHALREYVPGDDRRHVHWRSSARTGRLMVRQFEETRQSRVAVALDLADGAYASDAEFEEAVSAAASFVQQAFREENPVALVTNVEAHPGLTPTRLLNELSRVERHDRTHVTDVVRLVRDREPTASIVVVITGSRVPRERLRRATSQLGIDCRVICVRVAEERPLRVETVSNVTLVQLPSVADLPRAVRRAES